MSINVLVLGTKGSGKSSLCKYRFETSYVENDCTIYTVYHNSYHIHLYDIDDELPVVSFDCILLLWNRVNGTLSLSNLPERLRSTTPILFVGTKSDILDSSDYLSVSAKSGHNMNNLFDRVLALSKMFEE